MKVVILAGGLGTRISEESHGRITRYIRQEVLMYIEGYVIINR